MEESGGEDDEEEAYGEDLAKSALIHFPAFEEEDETEKGTERRETYERQSDDSLEARCHPVRLVACTGWGLDYAGTEGMRWAGSSSRMIVEGSEMVAKHLEARESWCMRWYMGEGDV